MPDPPRSGVQSLPKLKLRNHSSLLTLSRTYNYRGEKPVVWHHCVCAQARRGITIIRKSAVESLSVLCIAIAFLRPSNKDPGSPGWRCTGCRRRPENEKKYTVNRSSSIRAIVDGQTSSLHSAHSLVAPTAVREYEKWRDKINTLTDLHPSLKCTRWPC